MKTRAGFVSNSSSSSFLIVGKRLRKPELSEDELMDCDAGDYAAVLKKLGLVDDDDPEFQVIFGRDSFDDDVIVGFGFQDGSEYDWSVCSVEEVRALMEKAESYFGASVVSVISGIVNPEH